VDEESRLLFTGNLGATLLVSLPLSRTLLCGCSVVQAPAESIPSAGAFSFLAPPCGGLSAPLLAVCYNGLAPEGGAGLA
jgi:hypothetical protein